MPRWICLIILVLLASGEHIYTSTAKRGYLYRLCWQRLHLRSTLHYCYMWIFLYFFSLEAFVNLGATTHGTTYSDRRTFGAASTVNHVGTRLGLFSCKI